MFISWECICHGSGHFWYSPSIFRGWKSVTALRDVPDQPGLGTECGPKMATFRSQVGTETFMTASERVWIFPLLFRDYHYVVITITEIPFHPKGTEINGIFQKGRAHLYPVIEGKAVSHPDFIIC